MNPTSLDSLPPNTFRDTLVVLLSEGDGLLEMLVPGLALLRFANGERAVLVDATPGDLHDRLAPLVHDLAPRTLIIAGDSFSDRRLLVLAPNVYWVREDALEVQNERPWGSFVGRVLGAGAQPIAQRARPLWQDASERFARAQKQLQPLSNFQPALKPARATVGLCIAIGVMFLLQGISGALPIGEATLGLVIELGALSASHVRDGEIWRLISAGFLHGDIVHILMNGYVLWLLGRQLEAIIGSARFVSIYTFALIGAGLASTAYMDVGNISIGASGGIWGLLGAHAVLFWRMRPMLPADTKARMQRGLVMNFAINIGISFLPMIDTAAHFGGGIAGAVAAWIFFAKDPKKGPAPWQLSAARWLFPLALGLLILGPLAGILNWQGLLP